MLSTHMFNKARVCMQSRRSNSASVLQVGFSEQNVRALCDVGNSTKQHKVGYIGQKGIGFKSVFKVADVAEIHSSGFHISFDLIQHQSLGYILPTWVPVRPHAQPRVPSLESAATQVYLPYKQVSLLVPLLSPPHMKLYIFQPAVHARYIQAWPQPSVVQSIRCCIFT